MKKAEINRQLGTKWFTFYTKIRPWFSCVGTLIVVIDFFRFMSAYLTYWWLLLYLYVSIALPIICIISFVKSSGDYYQFVRYVKGALIFEIIAVPYNASVKFYIENNFDFKAALIFFATTLVVLYFSWYRLNMEYFERRIPIKTPDDAICNKENVIAVKTTETCKMNNLQLEATNCKPNNLQAEIVNCEPTPKVYFCRRCGNKLTEDSLYCSHCGTKIY